MIMMNAIIVGLNAALQKRCVIDTSLIPGNVLRATDVSTGVGGKGQDVAVSLHCLQYPNVGIAQFVGMGSEGDQVLDMMKEIVSPELTVRPESPLRTCTSIVAPDATTELVEPSGIITPLEMESLMKKLSKQKAEALCFMGSMPPGCPPETYASIYKTVSTSTTKVLIDSVAGLSELLKAIAEKEEHGPAILKLNASELCRLVNVQKRSDEAGGVAKEELVEAITSFLKQDNVLNALTAICITDGAHPAYLATMPVQEDEFRLFQLPVAKIGDRILFPIGAGDATAAGTLAAWHSLTGGPSLPSEIQSLLSGNESPSSKMLLTAFSFGLACGAASCLIEQNSVLRIPDVLELFNREGRPAFVSSHQI